MYVAFELRRPIILGTRDAIDATVRCMFGVEASEMSQLYFLKYAVAAGGFEPLIEASEGGGQQFKIKVSAVL